MYPSLPAVLFFALCISANNAARILGVFPFGAPSHYSLGNTLLKGLANAGHDVTMISPFSDEIPPTNGSYRSIVLDGFLEDQKKQFQRFNLTHKTRAPSMFTLFFLFSMGNAVTEKVLNHTKVQALMKSDEKFDVVIVPTFLNDALKALANHFEAHLVLFSNHATNSWIDPLVGNPSLPSFNPEALLGYTPNMSFYQRLKNTLFRIANSLIMNWNFYPAQNKLIQKYLPNPPDINDVLYNASLVLLNSHPSTTILHSAVPCMVEIGGFHVKPPKSLPKDLQDYLDNAKEGVIYFSMGSNLRSSDIPDEIRDGILKAFSKRKEKILWKWEDDVLPGQLSNVKLSKWFPQQDILAHPNVKVFVSHGGFLSTTETIYHGVPIVAIPIAGDQIINANLAEEAGFAVVLSYEELSEGKLTAALKEITTNPKYRDTAKTKSKIMKDRQVKPLDTAVYWIEYVIRHNGAKHLRVGYLDLYWYQYYLLDVFVFIVVTRVLFVRCVKKLLSYIRSKRAKSKSKED